MLNFNTLRVELPQSGKVLGNATAKQTPVQGDTTTDKSQSNAPVAGLTVEHQKDEQPLTAFQKQEREQAHQKELDKIEQMKRYSKAQNLDEVKNLKDMSLMSEEEIRQELSEYGFDTSEISNPRKLISALSDARKLRAQTDKGSDTVDGHIGTYVQAQRTFSETGGKGKYCTVLAQLDTMSDAEIKDMVQVVTGENGKKSYKITFPCDKGTGENTVTVTEEELKSGKLTVTDDKGEQKTLEDFPTGDADVTLITMAYVKRFGSDISDNGAWVFQTKNNFRTPSESAYKDNQHLEDITDPQQVVEAGVIGALLPSELAAKGYNVGSLANEDLSWIQDEEYQLAAKITDGLVTTLSDGRKACICKNGIFLSDGTKIETGHAMSIRSYDPQTKEYIISGNEFNNQSETRMPAELLQFMETGSAEGTPGVEKTPEPEL